MGQQQLLLMILVTIIVGIATVVAINTFENTRNTSNHDAIRQEMTDATSLAQAYYSRPSMMGGGGNSFTGISIAHLQIDESAGLGEFSLTNVQPESFNIEAIASSDNTIIIGTITREDITYSEQNEDNGDGD
jgi:Tfp pilus assembly protein PilE